MNSTSAIRSTCSTRNVGYVMGSVSRFERMFGPDILPAARLEEEH